VKMKGRWDFLNQDQDKRLKYPLLVSFQIKSGMLKYQ
jgi:hypothetical protein